MLSHKRVEEEPPAEESVVHPSDLSLASQKKVLGVYSGTITRLQLKRLCRQTFGTDWNARLACIHSGTAPTSTFN